MVSVHLHARRVRAKVRVGAQLRAEGGAKRDLSLVPQRPRVPQGSAPQSGDVLIEPLRADRRYA